mmetsp:Transcript_41841/g.102551  ORF Transcript_41841/g.102551 Transcript_41841/m.102551 type:complete len:282 (-) Transcript_41841:44-889(-)
MASQRRHPRKSASIHSAKGYGHSSGRAAAFACGRACPQAPTPCQPSARLTERTSPALTGQELSHPPRAASSAREGSAVVANVLSGHVEEIDVHAVGRDAELPEQLGDLPGDLLVVLVVDGPQRIAAPQRARILLPPKEHIHAVRDCDRNKRLGLPQPSRDSLAGRDKERLLLVPHDHVRGQDQRGVARADLSGRRIDAAALRDGFVAVALGHPQLRKLPHRPRRRAPPRQACGSPGRHSRKGQPRGGGGGGHGPAAEGDDRQENCQRACGPHDGRLVGGRR